MYLLQSQTNQERSLGGCEVIKLLKWFFDSSFFQTRIGEWVSRNILAPLFQYAYFGYVLLHKNMWNKFWIKINHTHIFKRTEIKCEGEMFTCVYCGFEMIKRYPQIGGVK